MSRKRKTANRRTSAKPKSPLESIKTESTSPMTLKACALAATGEELRLIMSQVLISQTHMVTYIKNSGIAEEISFQLFFELRNLLMMIMNLPVKAFEYLRTFLIDDVDLRTAIEMVTNLAKRDAIEDKEDGTDEVSEATIEAIHDWMTSVTN